MKRTLILPAAIVIALIVFFFWKKPFSQTREDAMELFDEGKYDESLELTEKLLIDNPDDEVLLFDRGVLKSYLSGFEGALVDFNRILEMHPENDLCRLERANIYNNLEDFESAMSDLEYLFNAKNKGTDTPMWTEKSESEFDFSVTMTEITYHRGITYGAIGKFQEAYDDFTVCINDGAAPTRQFQLSEAYYRRGEILILMDQTDDGCADLQKSKELGNPYAEETSIRYCP